MLENPKNEKESGLVVSQQTLIRNQAVGRPVGRRKKEGKKRGNMGKTTKKKKNEKELGLVVSQQTVIRNQAEKELGRTDRKFGIFRSKSLYPQILVPPSPSYPLFRSHQSFTFSTFILGLN